MAAASTALTPYTSAYTVMESLASAIAHDRANEVDYHGSTQHLLSLFRGVGALVQTGTPIQHNTTYSSSGDADSVLLYPQVVPHSTDEGSLTQQHPQVLPDHSRTFIHLPFTRTSPRPCGVSNRPPLHLPTPSLSGSLCQRDHRAFGLASRIPLEILDIIVSYIADCVGNGHEHGTWLTRRQISGNVEDSLQPLRSCAFVCRRWANTCRYGLFFRATLEISRSDIWEEFMIYSSRGCPSLVPIYKLITGIYIILVYNSTSRSFCHRIRDVPRGMLDHLYYTLKLFGPVPRSFPSGMLSTPHWSIPPNITTPHSLLHPFHSIEVKNVHMPSLLHVLKFIRYVAYTSSVYDPHSKVVDKGLSGPEYGSEGDGLHLNKLTWDSGRRQHYPFRFCSPYLSQLRPYDPQAFTHFFCEAHGCTSNIRLCTYAAIAHPHCWMHWLPMAEQEWILALMESFEDYFVDVTCAGCWLTIEMPNAPPGRLQNKWGITIMDYLIFPESNAPEPIKLSFYFEALPRNTTSKTSVRILGLQLQLDNGSIDEEEESFNIDALIQHLRKTSPGRLSSDRIVILVSAGTDDMLQELMERYRPVILDPQTEDYDYLFTYHRYHDSRDVAVDPVTLIPTGQSWKHNRDHDVDIIASLCKIPLDREDKDD